MGIDMSITKKELLESGYIHYPLPLQAEHSLEAQLLNTPVEKEQPLLLSDAMNEWHAIGEGSLSFAPEATPSGQKAIRFTAPSYHERRPGGRLEEGDCSNYGNFGMHTEVPSLNWEAYNRITFYLRADCQGVRHVSVTLGFHNDGKIKVPDIYNREGYHIMNLTCGEWNEFSLEIDSLPRDCITGLTFQSGMVGCETDPALGNLLSFTLGDIRLLKTAAAENTLGWELPAGKLAYCYSGYLTHSKKTAVAGLPAGSSFTLLNEKREAVLSGTTTADPAYPQVSVLDFSSVTQPGTYYLKTAGGETEAFSISDQIYTSSVWKTINFLFCERCGYPVPGYHQSCHRDILAHHDGKSFFCCGGWHDAADVSQQLIQTAEITYSFFEAADAYRDDPELFLRLREEGLWGLDYILKSRFGDGYRATSVGISMWTRGFLGDADDMHSRVHNNAYDNFLCAGVEAYCAIQLTQDDPLLAKRLIACAQEDFRFAREKFKETGFTERPPEYWEHSYMTSPSLFAATISWAASLLYQAAGDQDYAAIAVEYGDYVISCQAPAPDCNHSTLKSQFPAWGFFYRSPEKKSLQHFNHQARDQVYMQALTELCKTQPKHPAYEQWLNTVQLYGNYLKALMKHGNPYGMMPSGLYRPEEIEDWEAFSRQHLLTGDEVVADYQKQLQNGKNMGGGFYLKQFPVWFSFRGNNAVILSTGKAASLCGLLLKDRELMDIAAQQLEWNLGKNPFRQSLMYGEGRRYSQQYAVMPGEITGELPVGIQTLGNGDEPYWPQMNHATYKEIWTSPSARWLGIVADMKQML